MRVESCLTDLFIPSRADFQGARGFRKSSQKARKNNVTFVIDGRRYRIDGVQDDS